MTPRLAFVDTETTALGHLARPWEIAVITRGEAHGETIESEHVWQVEYLPHSLPEGTTPDALNIGGWWDRGLGSEWLFHAYGPATNVARGPEFTIARHVHKALEGAVLVGCGVHFDAAVLSAMFRRHGLPEEPWHYAIVDLKAATWDALSDRARVVPLPLHSEWLAGELEVEPPAREERHTALGDARWCVRWFDALTVDGVS